MRSEKVNLTRPESSEVLVNKPLHSKKRITNAIEKRLFLFPLFFLLIFAIGVIGLSKGEISHYNYSHTQTELFISINAWLSSWPVLWANLSELGDAFVLFPLLSFLILCHPRMWASLFGAIPLGALLSIGGKKLLAVPRPAAVLDPDTFEVIGHALKGHNSLPSGHTITVFACMTVILFMLIPSPRGLKQYAFLITGFIITGLIAFSRVAVGAHWPLDIFAGAFCGTLAGMSGIFLSHNYQRWWHWLNVEKYRFITGLTMMFWSVGLLKTAYNESHNSTIIIMVSSVFGFIASFYLLDRYIKSFSKNRVFKKILVLSR